MDKHFLEFWGNFMLSAAKGQRQVEEFSRWISQGMTGFEHLNAMLGKFYGLGSRDPHAPESWKAVHTSFEKAYRDYLNVLGLVPKMEYADLEKRLAKLREEIEERDDVIRKLRLELSASRMSQGDVVRGFQGLVQVQSEQFQKLTESFNRFFSGDQIEKKDTTKS
jgi:hypothetical protein